MGDLLYISIICTLVLYRISKLRLTSAVRIIYGIGTLTIFMVFRADWYSACLAVGYILFEEGNYDKERSGRTCLIWPKVARALSCALVIVTGVVAVVIYR